MLLVSCLLGFGLKMGNNMLMVSFFLVFNLIAVLLKFTGTVIYVVLNRVSRKKHKKASEIMLYCRTVAFMCTLALVVAQTVINYFLLEM
jgi:phosphotransferase system  glucose/maltose/N-acetylglucosamine-specific IIC component